MSIKFHTVWNREYQQGTRVPNVEVWLPAPNNDARYWIPRNQLHRTDDGSGMLEWYGQFYPVPFGEPYERPEKFPAQAVACVALVGVFIGVVIGILAV